MATMFQKATKKALKLRLALVGPSGSGKTYSALRIGSALLREGQRMAVVDTEHRSASKYADLFDFDVIEPLSFAPSDIPAFIGSAADSGYAVIVIDSLSHYWTGEDGALDLVDRKAALSRSGNSFAAWKDVTPVLRKMVDSMVAAPMHVVVTMRTKTEWVIEENERGKKVPRRVGLQPEQRAGLEYEFDVVGDLDHARMVVSKTRCPALHEASIDKPGEELAETLLSWLGDGVVDTGQALPPPAIVQAAKRDLVDFAAPHGVTPKQVGALIAEMFERPFDELSPEEVSLLKDEIVSRREGAIS